MGGNDSMAAKSWLSTGWQTYRKHQAVLVLGGLLWFAWDYVLLYLTFVNRTPLSLESLVVSLPFIIISVGLCFFCLKLSRGLEVPFSTIFEAFRIWWTALATGILLVLIFVAGLILLVVPSIIWALKYLLAPYALLDRQLSACEALKLSGRITTGHKGQLFYTGLISYGPALVVAMGAFTYPDAFFQSTFGICLGIAAFLVIGCVLDPWAACSFAVAYDRLSNKVPIKEEEGRVRFRQYEVWYRKVGECEGPGKLPLLCLHGGPGMPHDYLEPLEKIANTGRQVIFYDQLGSGESDHPSNPSLWEVSLFVEEVSVIIKLLHLKRVHILGQSWGGMLAMEYALTQPPGLVSLIIADSEASIPQSQIEINGLRAQLPPDVQEILSRHENDDPTEDPEYQCAYLFFSQLHVCRLNPWPWCLWRSIYKSIKHPEVYKTMIGPSDLNVTGKLRDWDIVNRLGEIHVPTLVLSGQYDMITPVAVEAVKRGIPRSEWVLFENSSHMPHLEETDRYLQVLAKFLNDVESRSSSPTPKPPKHK